MAGVWVYCDKGNGRAWLKRTWWCDVSALILIPGVSEMMEWEEYCYIGNTFGNAGIPMVIGHFSILHFLNCQRICCSCLFLAAGTSGQKWRQSPDPCNLQNKIMYSRTSESPMSVTFPVSSLLLASPAPWGEVLLQSAAKMKCGIAAVYHGFHCSEHSQLSETKQLENL